MAVDPTGETEGLGPGTPVAPLEPGSQLGKYKLERVLGAGGMGVVWAANDPDLERAVAIKLLRVADGSDTQRTRLLREARAMARLKHPNVLTVYEVGTAAGTDYIAMELVEGGSLADWLKTTPPRAEILGALIAAGRGLAAAHEAGIVHRDFKPENVLRDTKGHVFVTDFGLAFGQVEEDGPELVPLEGVAVGSGRPVDSVLDSPLTQTGVLIGTPAYMAPEQYEGKVGPKSDQFSFCVTAWEALTGERPFAGKTLAELRAAAGKGAGRSSLPARLHKVIARGLSRDPDARWSDMPALLRALEARPSRRRLWMTAGGFAIVAAAGIATIALRGGHAADDCGSAEDAFASAWSPAKRAEATKTHPGVTAIAQLTILDDTRRKWIGEYDAACKMPASAARKEQLACLMSVRDQVAETTKKADLGMMDVVGVAAAMDSCRSHSDTDEQ